MDDSTQRPQGNPPEQPTGQPQGGQQPQYPPPQQGYAPPGYPQQGYPQQPGSPPPGYQPQGAPPQGYPPGYQPGYQPGYPPSGYPPQQEPPRRRSGMPTWAWVVIGVGIALVACVAIVVGITFAGIAAVSTQVNQTFSRIGVAVEEGAEPIGVAYQFYDYLALADYDSAHALLGPDLASRYTPEDLQAEWEALESAHGPITADLWEDVNVDGTRAMIVQPLTAEDGESYTVTLDLEDTGGGEWLITEASPGLIPQP